MMQRIESQLPDNGERLQAAWGLVLPFAARIVVVGPEVPYGLIRWWKKLGVSVDLWQSGAGATPCELPGLSGTPSPREPSNDTADAPYDLALLWSGTVEQLGADLQTLQCLPVVPGELAVWSQHPGGPQLWRQPFKNLERSLRSARWQLQERHYAWPHVPRLRQIIEQERWTTTSLHMHRRSQRFWKNWALGSPLGHRLAPGNLSRWTVASRSATKSLLADITAAAASQAGSSLRTADLRVSPNGVAIVRLVQQADGQSFGILKVPLHEDTVPRVATNAKALQWMQEHRAGLGAWKQAPPALLAEGSMHGCAWTLEECVEGSEAQTWGAAQSQKATEHLAGLLMTLRQFQSKPAGPDSWCNRYDDTVEEMTRLLPSILAQRLQQLWRKTVRSLAGVEVRCVPQHGDCKLENALGDPLEIARLRVLDWELWRPDGLPLLDLLHLLVSRQRRLGGYSIGGGICRWLIDWNFLPWEKELIDKLANDVDPRYVAACPLLYWLERVGPVAQRGAWPNGGWLQANVVQVLDRLTQSSMEVVA